MLLIKYKAVFKTLIGRNINALKNDLGVVGFFLQVLNQSDFSLSHPGIGQLKNIFAYYYSPFNLRNSGNKSATQLLQMEFLLALKSQLEDKLDKWQEGKILILSVTLESSFFSECAEYEYCSA